MRERGRETERQTDSQTECKRKKRSMVIRRQTRSIDAEIKLKVKEFI